MLTVKNKYPFEWTGPDRTWWIWNEIGNKRYWTAVPNVIEETESRNGNNPPCRSQNKEGNGSFESLNQGRLRNMIAEEGRFPAVVLCMQQLFPNAVFQTCVRNPHLPWNKSSLIMTNGGLRHGHVLQKLTDGPGCGQTHPTARQASRGGMGPHFTYWRMCPWDFVFSFFKAGYSGAVAWGPCPLW